MRHRSKPVWRFCAVVWLFFNLRISEGQEQTEQEFRVLRADWVRIKKEEDVISAEGNVRMTHGDASFTAEKVTYRRKEGIVEAEGKVTFRRGKQFISGQGLRYDVKTGQGTIRFASSAMYPWYGWGERITRLSDKLYKIENGYVTTCDYLKPHWRIQAREILLYVDKKIVAKGAALYLGKVPLIYVPWYAHRLDDIRFPFAISPGRNSDWGGYILSAYSTVIKGVRTAFHLDYREKNGLATGVDAAFSTKGGKGALEAYYADDRHRELPDGTVRHDGRYRIHYEQKQELGADTSATVEINKISDIDFLDDFFRDRYEEEVQPRSFFNITKYTPRYTLSLFVRKRLNEFFTATERLPEASLEVREQRIAGTPFYYQAINSFVSLSKEFADDAQEPYDTVRFDSYHRFSFPRKYFGWLMMVPRLWLRGTYFGSGIEEDRLFRRAVGTELDFFTKIFRTWEVESPGLGIHGLRHVVEPRLTYAYAPDPNTDPEEVFQFDRVDTVDYMNQVRLGVRNKLQTKRENRTWDLIDFETYAYYFPEGASGRESRAGGTDAAFSGGRDFSDVFFDLEIWPSDRFKLDSEARWDTYDGEIEQFNTRLTVYNRDKWGASLEHRWLKDESDLLASEFYYRLSPDWAIRVHERYELARGELEEVELTVLKEMHDWQTAFSFRRREDENQFWVMFYLKGYPEVPIAPGH